jgi:hypothetical protein
MSDICNTSGYKNYPLLPSKFSCNTEADTNSLSAKYTDYGYIKENETASPVITPSQSSYKDIRLPGIAVTPLNNSNILIVTPTGTPIFTPTPTRALPISFYFEIEFTIFTELQIVLNLKTKKLLLKHLRDGNLPLNPIILKSKTYVNSMLTNSTDTKWTIPWSTVLSVDRDKFTATSNTIISELYKQGIFVPIVNNIQNLNEFKNIKIIEENNKIYFTGLWSDRSGKYINMPIRVLIKDYIPNTSQKISAQTSSEFTFVNDIIPLTTNYQVVVNRTPTYIIPENLYVKSTKIDQNYLLTIHIKDNNQSIKDISSAWNIGVYIN